MKYKIILENDISFDELTERIDKGSRFIAMSYCVSIMFAVTLRRFSPAFLIEDNSELKKIKNKYNRLTFFLGWWGIPWGPIYSVHSLQMNNKGGIDMTEDIILNIDHDSFLKREVELKFSNKLFCCPNKSDIKAFQKALKVCYENDAYIRNLVIAIPLVPNEGIIYDYTIGINVEKDFGHYAEKIKSALYTQFFKHTNFEFLDLSENSHRSLVLEKQGETLKNS